MAEVWEGRDEVLNRPVAVKMLLAHLAADPNLQERFRREAVMAARLVHPGIVAIFDAGVEVLGEAGTGAGGRLSVGRARDESSETGTVWTEQSSTAYIVMELVPGETLRDLISRAAPLPAPVAVGIATQVAGALAYAHAQGLVHRDIKPANVLLRDEGGDVVRVKVADFGIAKAAAAGGDLTASGTVLGTAKYLSPEQVQGKEPDARADLYSLGVVLFEMLAGRPPFQESTDIATALAHVQQPAPDLRRLVPGLAPELADLVGALLVKDPARRVPSALVLEGALARARNKLGVAGPPDAPGADLYVGPPATDRTYAQPAARAEVAAEDGTAAFPSEVPSGPTLVGPTAKGEGERGASGKRRPARKDLAVGPPRRQHRPSRLTSIVVGALLVAGVAVAAVLMDHPGRTPGPSHVGSGGAGGGEPGSEAFPPLAIVSVGELAQDGIKPNDNLSELPNVIGDDTAKYWESDIYKGAEFGGSGGFGLVLQLAGAHVLHQLTVSTPMDGWSAEVFTSTSDATTLRGWGQPRSRRASVQGGAVFPLGGQEASWVLFWMIDPGPSRQAVVRRLTVS
jgi:hypothetical protein